MSTTEESTPDAVIRQPKPAFILERKERFTTVSGIPIERTYTPGPPGQGRR